METKLSQTYSDSLDSTHGAPGALALQMTGITKRYGSFTAVDSVDLSVRRNTVLGLVGENGAGKSTILSIINGTNRPDSGTIEIAGSVVGYGHPLEAAEHGVATVFQEQGLIPSLPVYENMFLGREKRFIHHGILRRRRMIDESAKVLHDLGVEIDPTVATQNLSFGQRQLVEIGKAFATTAAHDAHPIILLDEPTSALSAVETDLLFESVRRWRDRATFVLVSHRLSDLQALCDDVAVLRDGSLIAQLPISETTDDQLHELMVGRKRDVEYYKEAAQRDAFGPVVLDVSGLSSAGRFQDANFQLRQGEIVGLAGVLGSGKSDLARAVAGIQRSDRGSIEIAGVPLRNGSISHAIRQGIQYVPAERTTEGVILSHSVEKNLTLTLLDKLRYRGTAVLNLRRSRAMTQRWIDRLRIKAPGPDALIGRLSGGNQQKVVFGRCLEREPSILVLDDPCRGLDVGAKEELYELVRSFTESGGSVILVSDNLPEIIGLSNTILVMRSGAITASLESPSSAKPDERDIVKEMV
ncbi:sugar ABC transporter ATP-binding protein [Rhodococcus jostii]|uniref:sugar ABC transporter ATP-binding protein n=1 Tax=Rhodococcus jostii TaxID=132919 RepID=UPI00363D472D